MYYCYLSWNILNFESNFRKKKKRLAFGDDYPGITHPLDGVSKMIETGTKRFIYFIQVWFWKKKKKKCNFVCFEKKVVPTIHEFLNGTILHTNQFQYTGKKSLYFYIKKDFTI